MEIAAGHLRGFIRRGGHRQLHLGRQVDGMAALGEEAANEEDAGAADFAGLDAAAQRQGARRIGAEVPDGGEAPARQHVLHVFLERGSRAAGRIAPHRLGEVDVAVPEAGHDSFSGAVDDAGVLRHLHVVARTDCGDDAVRRHHHGIPDWSRRWRGVDSGPDEREGVGNAGTRRLQEKQQREKRKADEILDHAWAPSFQCPLLHHWRRILHAPREATLRQFAGPASLCDVSRLLQGDPPPNVQAHRRYRAADHVEPADRRGGGAGADAAAHSLLLDRARGGRSLGRRIRSQGAHARPGRHRHARPRQLDGGVGQALHPPLRPREHEAGRRLHYE